MQLAPIPFSLWLRSARAALAEEESADVPCGSCNACCRTFHFIHVRPEEKRARARLPRDFLTPAPGLPPGNLVLRHDQNGCCPMLVADRCTVYEDRPLACRTYDCRVYAATGVAPDRDAIAGRVRRWTFGYLSQKDRELQAAVLAAVRFVREHSECLQSDVARMQPVRVAVLAIAVHEAFLPSESAGAAYSPSSDQDRVRIVAAANERLFGDG
jgi:Fe-S-cluster containining protein